MNPDQIKSLVDANWIFIMFGLGLVWKYVPQLKNLTNEAIPWVNLAAYVLGKVMVAPAHAGVLDSVPDAAGILLCGFTNSIWARQLYEGFGRGLIERLLHLKKPA